MKLIGSKASPFVRRVRVLLERSGKRFEFTPIDVMSKEGQEVLRQYGPVRRVPILVDGDKILFDSLIISQYVIGETFSIDDQLILKEIDELMDASLISYQLDKFNNEGETKSVFNKHISSRRERILDLIDSRLAENPRAYDSETLQLWLFTTLDWFKYREACHWEDRVNLLKFYKASSDETLFKETDPRL